MSSLAVDDDGIGARLFRVTAQAVVDDRHCQVNERSAQLWLDGELLPSLSAGTRHLIPHAERTGSQRPVVNRSEQVTADTEEVLHESVHREKPLRVRGGFEPAHLSLALSRRLM